jgi:hypothetical protein
LRLQTKIGKQLLQIHLIRVAAQLISFLSELPRSLTKEDVNSIVKTWARTFLNKPHSTRELRQKEYELSKQLRKIESGHDATVQAISDRCQQDREHSPHCGVMATHDENVAYENTFRHDYLGETVSLRDAMLAKLPAQPSPDVDLSALNGEIVVSHSLSNLADYLDGLAAKLP